MTAQEPAYVYDKKEKNHYTQIANIVMICVSLR